MKAMNEVRFRFKNNGKDYIAELVGDNFVTSATLRLPLFMIRILDTEGEVVGCTTFTISHTAETIWSNQSETLNGEDRLYFCVSLLNHLPFYPEIVKNCYYNQDSKCFEYNFNTQREGFSEEDNAYYIKVQNNWIKTGQTVIYGDTKSNVDIRRNILRLLYSHWEENSETSVGLKNISIATSITGQVLVGNLRFLEQENKVEVLNEPADRSKIISAKIKSGGVKEVESNELSNSVPGTSTPKSLYVNEEIIELIKKKNDGFDYKKLLTLVSELNVNYLSSNIYTTLDLIRSITDHIPPLLGYTTFEEVVNNYKWSQTDKSYMVKLLSDRPVSDDSLHRPISSSSDLLDESSIPNKQFLNRLLQECLEKTVKLGFKQSFEVKQKSKTKIAELRPILRAEILTLTGSSEGYFVKLGIRNIGKAPAIIKDSFLGDTKLSVNDSTLAENEQLQVTNNIEGSDLRLGKIEDPMLEINYTDINKDGYKTSYKINLELRADEKFNLQSLTDPTFE